MAYCRKCDTEFIFGLLGNPEAMDKIDQDCRKQGRKVIFAGCRAISRCLECGSILEGAEGEK